MRLFVRAPYLLLAGTLLTVALCPGAWLAARASARGFASASSRPAGAQVAQRARSESAPALGLIEPPGYATPAVPFEARLALGAHVDRATTDVEVGAYPCLPNRSEFDQTLAGNLTGTPSWSQPVPLTSLPADPQDPGGGVDLTVEPRPAQAAQANGEQPSVGLYCPQSEFGVYPVQVQLVGASGSGVIAQLTTYLVYAPAAAPAQPLRLALVVPLGAAQPASGSSRAVSRASAERLAQLASVLGASRLAVTLIPSGSTVSALAGEAALARARAVPGGPPSQAALTLSGLGALAVPGPGADREVVCGPYANVDASALVSAGLTGELTQQLHESSSVLRNVLHASCSDQDVWVDSGALTQSALNALGAIGYDDFVVAQGSVSGSPPSNGYQRLFDLGGARSGSVLGADIDPGLSSRLAQTSTTDPALVAQQFVTELEQIYFDAPNTELPRGVVVVAPSNWGADLPFVSDVVSALASDPMVRPVTLNELFAPAPQGVPVGGYVGGAYQPPARRPAAGAGSGAIAGRSIREARSRLDSFSAAVSGLSQAGASVAQGLNQLLLEAEAGNQSLKQQRSEVAGVLGTLDAQLHSVSVNAAQIRLASNAAPVPITVLKSSPYPVWGLLSVTSDKLVFPSRAQSPGNLCRAPTVQSTAGRSTFSSLCVISHSTNVIYVDMRTRATGDFRVTVTFTSPSGGLVLATAQLTVRSLSISAVSIVLSAAAVVVLLGWWGRTAWRKRKGSPRRRPAHARRSPAAA